MTLTPEQIAAIRAGRDALENLGHWWKGRQPIVHSRECLAHAATLTKLLEDNDG